MDGTNQTPDSGNQWQYNPEVITPAAVASPPAGPDGGITWTASEFIAHSKSPSWYGVLLLGAVAAAIVVWFITKDVVSSAFILFAAFAFGMFAGRQPRELAYRIDGHGLTIGPRQFDFSAFRSFSIVQEGAFRSIVFTPMKRFAPLTTIYYDPQDEAKIVDLLAQQLPHQERRLDPIDRLMWRIRF